MTSVEWYTPEWLVDRVRGALGGTIPLDPASCELANSTVRATRYCTSEDNGLSLPWDDAWFCNPPFGRDNALWVAKAIEARHPGILLMNGDPSSRWFHRLWDYPLVFLNKRTKFWGGVGDQPRHWQVLAGMRIRSCLMEHWFSDVGHVVVPLTPFKGYM